MMNQTVVRNGTVIPNFLSDPLFWALYSKEKNVCIRVLPGFISRDTIEATPSMKQNDHLQVLKILVEHLNI